MEHITTDIGSRIRQAREQRGLTIRDIANTTKISTAALNAIERNDFARLPGGVFSRAYVRAFATEVGLDADELTREYRARFEIEIAAGPLPSHKADWYDRLRPLYPLPVVLGNGRHSDRRLGDPTACPDSPRVPGRAVDAQRSRG